MPEFDEAFFEFRNLVERLGKPGVTNQMLAQARTLSANKRANGLSLERLAKSIDLCTRLKALLDSDLVRRIMEKSESSGVEVRSITFNQARLECSDAAITWARNPPSELKLEYESWAKNAIVICDIPLLKIQEVEFGFIIQNTEMRLSQLKVEQFFEIIENLARKEQAKYGGGF